MKPVPLCFLLCSIKLHYLLFWYLLLLQFNFNIHLQLIGKFLQKTWSDVNFVHLPWAIKSWTLTMACIFYIMNTQHAEWLFIALHCAAVLWYIFTVTRPAKWAWIADISGFLVSVNFFYSRNIYNNFILRKRDICLITGTTDFNRGWMLSGPFGVISKQFWAKFAI